MLKPEDFQLPLEKKLKLRVINDEIEECTSVSALQENLKMLAEQNMTFQHMIGNILTNYMVNDMTNWLEEMNKESLK